ncbi:MAG TPA: CHASE2 domain-containing protein, partial [Ramlibacter sp.]|nr:CHASE2 domain-containing protein [Ramlibacter sp.]
MGTSSLKRLGRPWLRDGLLAVAVLVAVVILHQTTDAIGTLERRFYDFAVAQSARTPSERIAILAIDDQSIANIGRWPWPRDVHADLIARLSAAKAKTIVHTSFFFEPQTDRGLAHIHKIRDALATDPAASGATAATLAELIAQAEDALDTDGKLAASMKQAGNVLIPAVFTLGEPQGRPDAELPSYVARGAVDERSGFSVPAVRGQYPIERLGSAAAGVGHLNQLSDVDGAVREDPLLVNYYGKAVPSLALLAAAHSLNLAPADIRLQNGQAVQLGRLRVRTDDSARMLAQFYRPQGARPAFAVDSVYDVLSGKIPAAKYADKIVLIGATAAGVGTAFPVPGYSGLSPAEMLAHITSSILSEHVLTRPDWAPWAGLGILLVIAGYLLAALPRLSAAWGAGVTATLFVGLFLSEYLLLASASIWLPLMFPATALLAGHLALTTRRFLVTEAGKLKSDDESA